MKPLDADALRAIKELIAEPLMEQVSTSMDAGHDRLAAAIERVGARLADHVAATAVAARDRDAELAALRERVGRLERFKRHLAVVYAAVALVAGTAWGVLVDWVKGEFFAAKP